MKNPHSFIDAVLTFVGGLVPGALGASIALLYERGLTWGDRFAQLAVGTIVSFFAQRVIGAVWAFDPFVLQGVGFSAGMVAFRACPRIISAAADVAGTMPIMLRDKLLNGKRAGLLAILTMAALALGAVLDIVVRPGAGAAIVGALDPARSHPPIDTPIEEIAP